MIRAAIIGLGWWGRIIVDSVQCKSDHIRFTTGYVRNSGPVAAYAASRDIRLAPSFEAVLADPEVDAVVLATPHSVHVEQIKACAAAGKPVFTEKPLALTLDEAQSAVAACESADVLLALGTDRRMLPAMLRLSELVQDGTVGEVLHVEAQYSNDNMGSGVSGDWRKNAAETPGLGMTGPGLHVLDALIGLAGPVRSISGQATQPFGPERAIDTVALNLSFDSGISGLLGVVRGVPNYFRVAVFGTEGWAELRDFGDLHIALKDAHPVLETYDRTLAVGALIERFAMAIIGVAPFPIGPADMLRTVAAFETAVRATREAGWHDVTAHLEAAA